MWMSFNQNFTSLAATDALSEVLDPTYVPSDDEAKIFQAKNIFMYSVFTFSLLSAKSKVALRTHEATKNAQAVYKDLLQAYSDGTTAALTAENLENQLRAMKLDNSWNKPLETFLHLWSTHLHDLETVKDDSVADKCHWFINSIKSSRLLRSCLSSLALS